MSLARGSAQPPLEQNVGQRSRGSTRKQTGFPPLVERRTTTSSPSITAKMASFCPGKSQSKPKMVFKIGTTAAEHMNLNGALISPSCVIALDRTHERVVLLTYDADQWYQAPLPSRVYTGDQGEGPGNARLGGRQLSRFQCGGCLRQSG